MIFKSIGNLYFLGIAGSVFSLFYNMLMALHFGTGPEVEAFFAAVVLNGSMRKISQAGYLMDIFLPHYFQIRRDEGRDAAYHLISVLINQFFLAGLVISAVFIVLAPYFFNLLVGGFDESVKAEAVRSFYWLAPLMPIQVAGIVMKHLLNSEKMFGRVELMSVVGSIVSVVTLFTLHSKLGVRVLVLNVLLIEAIQLMNAIYCMRKLNYRHSFALRSAHIPMREMLLKLGSTSGYLISVQILDFTVNNLLSGLPQGTFAVYRYAERVFMRASSLILNPVTTVLKVVINESVSASKESSRATVGKAIHFGILTSLLFFFAFLVCGTDSVQFLFRGDRFPLEQVRQTKILLAVFFGTTVFTAVDIVYQTTSIALGKGKMHYILRIAQNIAGSLLAAWLISRWEFEGVLIYRIASTGIAIGISFWLVWVTARQYLASFFSLYTLRILVATAIGYVVLAPLHPYLQPLGQEGGIAHFFNAAFQASLYCLIAYPLARWMGISEIALIEGKVRGLIARIRKGKP